MDIFIETIRNVVLIVFFASIVEMFLPKSTMGKYVQLIMGLFVIVTILNPILSINNHDFQLKAIMGKAEQAYESSGLSQGLMLKENNEDLVKDRVIATVKKQIAALATLVPGVENADVELVTDPSFLENGKIEKITIHVKSGSAHKDNSVVETIDIGQPIESKTALDLFPEETLQRVKETVANFYGLDMNTVEVFLE